MIFGVLLTAILVALSGVKAADIVDSYGNIAYANGTVSWVEMPAAYGAYSLDIASKPTGKDVLFLYAREFLNTILPKPVPFDLLKEAASGEINIPALLSYAVRLFVCLVAGAIFLVFVPLCGCLICCCRCCGNCGGKMAQTRRSNDGCRRMGLGLALLTMSLFTGMSVACLYISSVKLTDTLSYTNTTVDSTFSNIDLYINSTITEFRYLVVTMYDLVMKGIERDIDDIGAILGNSLISSLLPMVDPAISAITALDTTLQDIMTSLDDVTAKLDVVKAQSATLSAALDDLRANISQTKANCSSYCGSLGQTTCTNFDENLLALDANFSTFPDINSTAYSLSQMLASNLTALALTGKQAILDLPDVITNQTLTTREAVKTTLSDLAVTLEDVIVKLVSQLNGQIDFEGYSKMATDYVDIAVSYDSYRLYTTTGLCTAVFLSAFSYLLGLLCGVAGYKKDILPTERGSWSNCGGRCLLCGVFLAVLFSIILMLLTTITFLLGGSLEKICESVTDLSIFSEFIDEDAIAGFSLSSLFSASSSLTFATIFRQCKGDAALLSVFRDLVPIDSYLDYENSLGDINSKFSNVSSSFDLSAINILDNSTTETLNSVKTSDAVNVNFTAINDILNQNLTSFNRSALVEVISVIITNCTSPTSDEWQFHSDQLVYISDVIMADLNNALTALNTSLGTLQTALSGIELAIDNTIDGANSTQTMLLNSGAEIITNDTMAYLARILDYAEQYKQRALYLVYNDMAGCLPLWSVYERLTALPCSYVVDSLNGMWFSIGWSLFLLIPAAVTAVKLSRHYRRMDSCEGYPTEYDGYYDHANPGTSASEA